MLMRLKQICNHPSQWLNDDAWAEEDSGKWARLREIAEVIAARQEKLLLFTQFREMTAPLADIPRRHLWPPGLVLHGETPVKNRRALVQRFQHEETVPFFVLSLRAGGTGLNADRRVTCRALRSLVEPRGGEPGHRSRLPHRTEEECPGA